MGKSDLKYNSGGFSKKELKAPTYATTKQCNSCGYIAKTSGACPKCDGSMFKYVDKIG